MSDTTTAARDTVRAPARVPGADAPFWVTKALTTAMGEALSDYLVHTIAPVLAVAAGVVGLLVALAWQLRAGRYVPSRYWLAVSMVGVTGTMAADVLHVAIGVPYIASTIVFAVVLAGVFWTWWRTEGTLSIHDVTTPRRELYYWAAVIATFALGTAAGDLVATTFGLGYLAAGFVFAAMLVVPIAGRLWFGLSSVAAFWFAYVLTRPIGASFADYFGVSHERGGLALGSGHVAAVLIVAIAAMVAFMSRRLHRTVRTA
jgi:uncharacterized membrane-anchored protein